MAPARNSSRASQPQRQKRKAAQLAEGMAAVKVVRARHTPAASPAGAASRGKMLSRSESGRPPRERCGSESPVEKEKSSTKRMQPKASSKVVVASEAMVTAVEDDALVEDLDKVRAEAGNDATVGISDREKAANLGAEPQVTGVAPLSPAEDSGFMPLDPELEADIQGAVTRKGKRRRGVDTASIGVGGSLTEDQNVGRVLYVAHIPHGFYEDQMAGFFGQFGKITRLRLSRNKKTGKSKHFAFLEFEVPEVAAIVAECMHNYLLLDSVLQCRLVPPEKLHPMTWVGSNRKFARVPWKKLAKERHNQERDPLAQQKVLRRQLRSEHKRRAKLAAAGIDYDYEPLVCDQL